MHDGRRTTHHAPRTTHDKFGAYTAKDNIGMTEDVRRQDGATPTSAPVAEAAAQAVTPMPSAFERVGGEAKVRELIDRFYDLMDLEPEFTGLRALHPASLDGSRDKLFWFLCGWLGGPDHYISRFGHPRLRARHLPFAIASPERDQWLRCMAWAMEHIGLPHALREQLLKSFFDTADWMRNRPG
jgi:hemoglobin